MRLSTHSARLERWLGAEGVERISSAMRGVRPEYRWYGPPIGVANTPGRVYATADGDFVGPIRAGQFASIADYYEQRLRRISREWAKRQRGTMNAGFSSLSDLINEATIGGKKRTFVFQKVGTTGVVASTNTLWFVGTQPPSGAAAGAAPGGTIPTDASTGAFLFDNPTGGDTQHFTGANPVASAVNTLLLYDRLFSVTKTMNSTATEAVTGVPTRYQSSTATAMDYSGGNFLIIECRTALPNTAHNWTVCTYVDQDGNTGATLPSVTGNNSNIINRLDQPANTWFAPLASGDYGIKALTQMQCSALVATGAIDFTIGHPIAWMPCPIANIPVTIDGINSAFNLARIFDDACMAFLEITKPATAATTYNGAFETCYG